MSKHKSIIYIDGNLFDSIEIARGFVPRSVFLENIIENGIDNAVKAEENIEKVAVSVYLNSDLHKKVLSSCGNSKVSNFLKRIIITGLEVQHVQ
jgi:hypothetical protein